MTSFLREGRARPVAIWLFVVAVLVFGMVVLGGSTRLTNSGVSITQWELLSGTIPPLNLHQWQAEFDHYKQIPQYKLMNPNMTLAGFKTIFWWEWSHRQLGRLVGLACIVPFIWFLWRKMLPGRLIWRCAMIALLVVLQGVVGIWMVKSGLVDRTEVAPERLTLHLGLALVLFCFLIWTGFEAWAGPKRPYQRRGWPGVALGLAALVFLQILLGGLVAGNRAGLIYNDWPFFGGKLWPSDYVTGGLRQTLLHSLAAVQANHRLVAYALFVLVWVAAVRALRSHYLPRDLGGLALILALMVTLQAGLGIGTLMMQVPLGMALAHQLTAAVVLAVAVGFAWRARRQ